jgi:exodeoxyribonuclease VIII
MSIPYNKVSVEVDLETASTRPDAAIIAIGAVIVGSPDKEFFQLVSLADCVANGRHVDTGTMTWWSTQPQELRERMFSGTTSLKDALLNFNAWLQDVCPDQTNLRLWGNGAMFDNTILVESANAVQVDMHWSFRSHMCYKTIRTLHRKTFDAWNAATPFEGTPHDPVADARHQAKFLEYLHGGELQVLL